MPRRRPALFFVSLAAGSLALLAVAGAAITGRSETPRLTVFGPAPAFALTDHLDRPVRSEDLRGTVIIANFIYTSCQDICPLLSVQMQGLQDRLRHAGLLGQQVQLLSFTVDPERDTPAMLASYAKQHGADPQAWRFLTGAKATMVPLIVDGFHLGVEALPQPDATVHAHADDASVQQGYDVMHSGRFVLIDRHGQVRAYYDGRTFAVEQVLSDIRALLR